MMMEKKQKYIFGIFSVLLLVLMLFASGEAGVSCDEVLHYDHSEAVYRYFATDGKDRSALNTPETHLKYYGQSYDNITTILIKWTGIEDVYYFRHLMSAIAGWLTVIITAWFAIWLSGFGAGILVIFLFAVSPTFMGHAQNNLKDVPFALAYISGLFFMLRFLFSRKRVPWGTIILLIISIAFCISIRAGGLLLICYLFLFFFLYYAWSYFQHDFRDFREFIIRGIIIAGSSVAAFFLSTLLWPFALQDPLTNIMESYNKMAHFPGTFRQLFEGKTEWSDYMPWYYLLKSIAVTVPAVIFAGLILFALFIKRIAVTKKGFAFFTLVISVLFPVIFVIIQRSNLYSSWRQFLFIYPGIVLTSAFGFYFLIMKFRSNLIRIAVFTFIVVLSAHPVKFMVLNVPYSYLYYNEFTGGLKGAYGKYETDYYYVSQTRASEWLINHIEKSGLSKDIKVKATYTVDWQFRDHPEIKTSYFRFEERSMSDWDYAISVNRYIPLSHLKNKTWPPENTIHVIYADSVPLCAVVERRSKDDYFGYVALKQGRTTEAIHFFEKAVRENCKDEMIFYNFAAALKAAGQEEKADSILKAGLTLNPSFEPILMYLGNMAEARGDYAEAVNYYERLIDVNRKYFEAYVELARIFVSSDILKARRLLRECLIINPGFKPAVSALADTYRNSDPETARKYDELLKRMNK